MNILYIFFIQRFNLVLKPDSFVIISMHKKHPHPMALALLNVVLLRADTRIRNQSVSGDINLPAFPYQQKSIRKVRMLSLLFLVKPLISQRL